MRHPLGRVALALMLLGGALARVASAQDTRAAGITAWAAAVDGAARRWRHVDVPLTDRSTEGGTLRVFVRRDSVRKLEATYLGETGRASSHFYPAGVELRYASRREARYDRPMSGRVVRTQVDRYWFAGDTLLRWTRAGRLRRVDTDSARAEADRVLAEFRDLVHVASVAVRRARR